jgi:hypothetical protein
MRIQYSINLTKIKIGALSGHTESIVILRARVSVGGLRPRRDVMCVQLVLLRCPPGAAGVQEPLLEPPAPLSHNHDQTANSAYTFFSSEILYLYRTYSDHKHSWKRFSVGKWLRCGCGLNSVGMRRANGTVLTILKWRRSTSRSQSVPVSAAVLSPKLYSRARHGWSEGRLRRAWG